jgi:non-specific serine/threonine protein kinase
VLDQPDLQAVLQEMQPLGREMVRLGWETPHTIPDPLRAICNRATDRQPRQRYHLARSFLRALDGWRTSAAHDSGGPIALLMDKLARIGHLPTTTSGLHRLTSGSGFESQHTRALAETVLKDMALSLELLRRVNNQLRQSGLASSGDTVLNMQRAIQMLGLNGVQLAANSLKPWPGPLQPVAAELLRQLMVRVHKAGQVAQALRPAGYDDEVVYLVTVMQNLGRLLLQYHFPDDAQQIRQLMLPPEATRGPQAGDERRPPPEGGDPARGGPSLAREEQPNPIGMTETAAAYAVLGCSLEQLSTAVARQWALGDELLHMIRRQPLDTPVHTGGNDAELLRLTCSLANELLDAVSGPEAKRRIGIEMATRRYGKVLELGLREVMDALNPGAARASAPPAPRPPPVPEPSADAAGAPSPLRSKLAARTKP